MSSQHKNSNSLPDTDQTFYKSRINRTIPVRYANDEKYEISDIEAEYKDLVEMHSISPENVVEPYHTETVEGQVEGYHMEEIKGQHLKHAIDEIPESEAEEILAELEETIEEFHSNGIAHGDLYDNVIYSEQDGIKIIDPVGAGYTEGINWPEGNPQSHEDLIDELADRDLDDLDTYNEKLSNDDLIVA